jgi:hypothetical protein
MLLIQRALSVIGLVAVIVVIVAVAYTIYMSNTPATVTQLP